MQQYAGAREGVWRSGSKASGSGTGDQTEDEDQDLEDYEGEDQEDQDSDGDEDMDGQNQDEEEQISPPAKRVRSEQQAAAAAAASLSPVSLKQARGAAYNLPVRNSRSSSEQRGRLVPSAFTNGASRNGSGRQPGSDWGADVEWYRSEDLGLPGAALLSAALAHQEALGGVDDAGGDKGSNGAVRGSGREVGRRLQSALSRQSSDVVEHEHVG